MKISIITSENRRLYPAIIYDIEDNQYINPIIDIDGIYDLLYTKQSILVSSNQYDQYGNEVKVFNGKLEKSDIKALFAVKDEQSNKDLNSVMTLSEAAKKWGLSDGSTIRKSIERGKFEQHEIKQAGGVWIISCNAMERVFGDIKNEENAYVIYDDFETVFLTKVYYEYAQLAYLGGSVYDAKSKDIENKYQYIKEVFMKGQSALRNNQKVVIKKSRNNQIRQVICTEDEFFLYIETFRSRRNLSPELINRLIDDLKEVHK
ncbi:MAG TPA: helix-turn-helix domain-containing protein [Clostridium sp.]